MKIFPAIDILGGKAVRLTKGDYSAAKVYSSDPVSLAARFKAAGADCLHVVDLDGAKSGRTENGALIEKIVKSTDLSVQVGGGIRDETRVRYYLDAGAARVILGTAAVRDPEFLAAMVSKFGDKIAAGADVADGFVAVDGWTKKSGKTGFEFVAELRDAGVKTVIYTDISRDGMLNGANLEAYARLSTLGGINIIASGGITDVSEITELKKSGVYGAIAGKAIYEGRLNLTDCLAAAKEKK